MGILWGIIKDKVSKGRDALNVQARNRKDALNVNDCREFRDLNLKHKGRQRLKDLTKIGLKRL